MRQINRLSDSVVSRLRSGTNFSDIAQIVEELVCNSIDAGASQVQIDVDIEACFVKVEDDGCGISRDDLTIVGERHSTSKLHDLEELETGVKTLGFRGEALSSLSDIALVEITSRCPGKPNTYRKIMKDCATVSIGLCSQQRSHGTTVVVKDMFYNQPVRRRLMSTSNRKILQSVKERILRFILMHPTITFKVTDLARLEVSVHSKSAISLSTRLCGMFGEDLLLSLEEVDCCQGPLRITGYLSRKYHCLSSKTVQFFYINRRFVKKTPIHKLVNKWAQTSKNCRDRVGGKHEGSSEKRLLPAFVLNLTCPLSEYDITFEASKTTVEFKDWSPVVDFVKSVLQSMWGILAEVLDGGLIQACERSPELSVKIEARSKIVRQHASSVPYPGSKNIPPMSVRRALVQGGLVDLCNPMKDTVEQRVGESKSHCPRQSRSRPGDPASPAHDGHGGRGERRYQSQRISNAPEILEKTMTGSSTHHSDNSSPRRPWTMASCGQRETIPKSVLPFVISDLSIPCVQAPRSSSASASFTNLRLELSPDCASVTSRCVVERVRSFPEISQTTLSPSLAETCTMSTMAEGVMEHSTDLNSNFMHLDKMELENDGASSEVPDLNMGAMLWSGSDDWHNNMSSPDSSYFLPEVRRHSPNVSDLQENFPLTFSGSDESAHEAMDKPRIRVECFTANEICGSGNVDVDYLVCDGKGSRFKDSSMDLSSPSQSERDSLKVKTRASKAHKVSDQQESYVRRRVSNYSDRHRLLYASHQDQSGKSSNSPRPRVKRKLEMFLSGHTNNLGSVPESRDDPEASTNEFDRSSYTVRLTRQRRSHSGPPFYIPPNRCGLHENPPNSLSTAKESMDIFKDVNHSKNRTGATAAAGEESTGQAFQYIKCPMDESSFSFFRSPCRRKGLELDADDTLEISNLQEGCSILLSRKLDTSAVRPVQLELPDVTSRNHNEDAPPNDTIGDILKEWSNPCLKNDEGVLDLSSGILCWNSISFLPDSIVKESLQHARVLRQVDKKFIPAVASGVLLMIDQHAADERVRLEELRDSVLGSAHMKQAAPLSCTKELPMAFTEQQILQTYREQIEDWGWRFRLPFGQSSKTARDGSSVVGTGNVLLSAVPCILGVMLTGDDLTEYLRQLMDTQGSSAPPPAVIRVLNYKACRGAIMFGDTLLPAESRQLVEHLRLTSLCFQCAHGRPTMVPLVDLRALHKRLLLSHSTCGNSRNSGLPSGSTALKSGLCVTEWHRLQHKTASLKRSLKRLKQINNDNMYPLGAV